MICYFLESAAEIYSELYGTSFLHKSFVHRFKVEGCIVFVQEVTCPEADHCIPFFKICTPVQCAVKRLANIIQFRPVDASGSIVVCLEYNTVEDGTGATGDGVFSSDIKRMLGDEGNIFAVVVSFYC